jgi:hydrogenase maturation protease
VNGEILVACIGNIFMGDDAFGPEMAKQLAGTPMPEGVTVRDFGIRSYDLAYALMQDWELVILVDAMPGSGTPGTLYAFEPELPTDSKASPSLDAHNMSPVAVLRLVHVLGGKVRRLLVVGCEPESVEPNSNGEIGLSVPVKSALEEGVQLVHDLIASARSHALAA